MIIEQEEEGADQPVLTPSTSRELMGVFTEPQVAQQSQPWQEHPQAGEAKAVSNVPVTLCPGWCPALLLNVLVGTWGRNGDIPLGL